MADTPASVVRTLRQYHLAMTQEEFAQTLGVSFSTGSRWEKGHQTPSALGWKVIQDLAAQNDLPDLARAAGRLSARPGQHRA